MIELNKISTRIPMHKNGKFPFSLVSISSQFSPLTHSFCCVCVSAKVNVFSCR